MFKGIKNTYQKSLGAVVAQNLLEMHARRFYLQIDAQMVANRLVEAAWSENEHLFDGRYGQRPFKSSIAAAAFGKALRDRSEDFEQLCLYGMCLGTILQEIEVNGHRYPLNGIDLEILEKNAEVLRFFSEDLENSQFGQEIGRILNAPDKGEHQ
ncbi:hypothetical protein [Rhodovulum euryhalinum]|uniref:hypothetical protein n=1 Tax=Rhodovulum euryhalinum TaxID=35805 RepID=UPI00140520B8|nr:hypothetical protein [Rhodovulum euryhalinum]